MTTTFDALGVSAELVAALKTSGINDPFPIQALTIPDALAGRDVSGKAKTGSGKTLAFGLPILQLIDAQRSPGRPLAIVLVPTRELALQVHGVLKPLARAREISVVAVYGGARIERQMRALDNGVDVVVATPGRMIDLIDRGSLRLDDVRHVVVDEADRMADMGFLPQVEWILRHIQGKPQTLLFSATLDGVVNTLINRYQSDPVLHEVESTQVTVDEMEHRFLLVHQLDKVKVAKAIASGVQRTLVFVRTKRGADRLVRQLEKEGIEAAGIHGDLRQAFRERSLRNFASGSLPVLVATDVAARGIHVDDIDVVIHYDPPEEHKAYLHRSGRTARAGESGVVVTLVLWDEELEVRRLQKRIGVQEPITEVFSNDPRLADLSAWDIGADEPAVASATVGATN